MANVTGRWAVVLIICTSAPTMIRHILDKAGLVTILWRTCLAAAGALGIGLFAEWYMHSISKQVSSRSAAKGQHVDLTVGPTSEEQTDVLGDASLKGRLKDG